MIVIPSGVIFIWSGTHATIPTGWERVTALDGLYSKGTADATDPDTTGGAATHEHTGTTHSHTDSHTHTVTVSNATTNYNVDSDTGTGGAGRAHSHTATCGAISGGGLSNISCTYSAISNDPPFYEVIFITPTSGVNELPANAIYLYDDDDSKAGHYLCDGNNSTPNLVDKYLKGASTGANAGTTGGSVTNVHDLTHTHTVAAHDHADTTTGTPSSQTKNTTGDTDIASGSHTHTINPNATTSTISGTVSLTTTETVEPAYKKLLTVQNQNTGSGSYRLGMIGMWLGTLANIPENYLLCDGSNGTQDMRGKHLKSTSTTTAIGNTGGSNTHTHASQNHTHTASGTHTHTHGNLTHARSTNDTKGSVRNGCNHQETHTVTFSQATSTYADAATTGDEQNNEPPYRTVAFIKLNSVSTDFVKAVDDAVTIADSLKKATGKFVSDAITTASNLLKGTAKTFINSISKLEIISFVKGSGILLLDAVSHTESFLRGIGKSVLDAVSATETLSKGITRAYSDLVHLVDTTTKGVGRLLSDAVSHTESMFKAIGKFLSSAVSITETFLIQRMFAKIFTETVHVSDLISFILDKFPGIINWLKFSSQEDKAVSLQTEIKPLGMDSPDTASMSSGQDTPISNILEGERPNL